MWLALISFLLPVVHFSSAQYPANVGQQYVRTQGAGGQYQFWRPQFDHSGQYQQAPQYQAPQPSYQNQGSAGYQEAPQQFQQPQQPQQYQPQQQQYQQQPQFPAPQQYQPQQQAYQQNVQVQRQPYQQVPQNVPQQQQPQAQRYQQPQQYQQNAQPQQYQQPAQPQQFQQPAPSQQSYQPQAQQQSYEQQAGAQSQYQQQQPQVYREQPQLYQQQVKTVYQPQVGQQQYTQQQVNPAAPPQPPPPPPPAQPTFNAQVPPPPERFVPYVSDVYHPEKNISPARLSRPQVVTILTQNENIPEGTYVAEEIIVDGNHPSYVENVERHSSALRVSKKFISSPTVQQQRYVPQPEAKLKAPIINSGINVPSVLTTGQRQQPPPPPPPVAQATRPQNTGTVSQGRKPSTETVKPSATSALSGGAAPSAVFLECCKKRKVAKPCERICNFDVLSKKTLTGMFLGTDPCPQSYGLDLLQCAAQNDDHTECCRSKDVHRTSAGEKCLGFCNMRPGITFQADVSMLPCWAVLSDIKSCFKEHIEEHD